MKHEQIIKKDDLILVTGAGGFIGTRVVESLLGLGFRNLRCLVRPSGDVSRLNGILGRPDAGAVEVFRGNLLSREDCDRITSGVSVIYHLAAGIDKSFPGAFMNSVVTTRNLLDAALQAGCLKRFVNVSSFAVYSNMAMKRGALLDETCALEDRLLERHEAYLYGKAKQDEMLMGYSEKHNVPYVIIRPGVAFGPGKNAITGRVGINTFGFFMHLGGSNKIPLTYVSNCADAIALSGIVKGVDGEVFNIVDDDLPTSRKFLRLYKRNVGRFRSVYVPYRVFYLLCWLWERYSKWSEGQLPPVFNRRRCAADWKGNAYTNEKAKRLLGWAPAVPMDEAMRKYFEYVRRAGGNL